MSTRHGWDHSVDGCLPGTHCQVRDMVWQNFHGQGQVTEVVREDHFDAYGQYGRRAGGKS